MSNVKALEYLLGISFYVIVLCTLGAWMTGLQGNFSREELLLFTGFMFIGIIVSPLVRAAVGICCKNQMNATSVSVPFMLIFSFVPMLSMFNERIKDSAQFLGIQQRSHLVDSIHGVAIDRRSFIIILLNALLAFVLFLVLYRKKGLEN